MLDRFKQAAMVLAGHRPAEVRFDRRDQDIARVIAERYSGVFADNFPDVPGLADEVDMAIDAAITDYTSFEEHERRRMEWARRQECDLRDVPF